MLAGLIVLHKGKPYILLHMTCPPAINEFVDVLTEDFPRLPPHRDIKFSIDLVPGTAPISITPYGLVSAEHREYIG